MVVARSSQAVIGASDALMTAPLGEAPVAAVTTGAMNAYALVIVPMGVAFMVQSFAAQLSARGEVGAARRYAWYGLMVTAAVVVAAVASTPLIGPLLSLLPFEPDVRGLMTSYLTIRMFALGGFIGTEALGNWFGGLGNTRLQMIAGVLAMVVNVFLNWVLIFGNLGAPAMGVEGAAWASVVASWSGFAFLAVVFAMHVRSSRDEAGPLQLGEIKRLLRFGVPNGFNWFLEFAAFIVFLNVIVADLGTTVLAAMMVVININSVSFMPAFGLSSSGAILAGQAIGSGRRDDVPAILKTTMAVTATWQGLVGLAYLLLPTLLMSQFQPDSADTTMVELGAVMLAISAAWQLFDSVTLTTSETLRAAGDTSFTMWARLCVAWGFFAPGAYFHVRSYDGGYVAAMLWLVAYTAILAAVFALRFRNGAWRKIDLTGEDEEALPAA